MNVFNSKIFQGKGQPHPEKYWVLPFTEHYEYVRINALELGKKAPNPEQQVAIWKVLSREFNHEISNAFIVKVQELVGTDITGREIKNLLKLGILRAKKINNGLLTPEIIHFVSKYQNYVVRKG